MSDDDAEEARSREEAALALVLLAGVACILWTPTYGRLMDSGGYDGLLVAVVAFIGGGIYGGAVYWASGALVRLATRLAGGRIRYRLARHLVAYSAAPLALSLLVLWPLRLAVYGEDVFRSGGSDSGLGNTLFGIAALGFVAWSLALLAIGIRTVTRWPWTRSLNAWALAAAAPVALAALTVLR